MPTVVPGPGASVGSQWLGGGVLMGGGYRARSGVQGLVVEEEEGGG